MRASCKAARVLTTVMRQCVRGQVAPSVLKHPSPFSFRDTAAQDKQLFFPDCLTLEGEGSTFL